MELGGKSSRNWSRRSVTAKNGGVDDERVSVRSSCKSCTEASDSDTPPINVTEYLEHLDAAGVNAETSPDSTRLSKSGSGRGLLIAGLNPYGRPSINCGARTVSFMSRGGVWTGDRSWVRGYENVLGPNGSGERRAFSEAVSRGTMFRSALSQGVYYLLVSQTSCFRYWGEGIWPDYGRKLLPDGNGRDRGQGLIRGTIRVPPRPRQVRRRNDSFGTGPAQGGGPQRDQKSNNPGRSQLPVFRR